jgi:hypothetical protein
VVSAGADEIWSGCMVCGVDVMVRMLCGAGEGCMTYTALWWSDAYASDVTLIHTIKGPRIPI